MFYAEDEDVTNKAQVVSPNDVIDIEVSPLIRAQASSWLKGFDKPARKPKTQPPLLEIKEKKSKKLKNNSSTTPKKQKEIMKRGDPFLPFVTNDENPVADFSTKKGTHKKPLDCKCKGMGFNCSPSAVLPEEMRQQWGYGMFGKPTSTGTGCVDNSEMGNTARTADIISNNPYSSKFLHGNKSGHISSPWRASSGCTPSYCSECKNESCCCPPPKLKHESFSFSEGSDKKRQKLTSKSSGYKIKGSKTQILISSKNNLQAMKKIACINNKDHTNIISTSNFNKNNYSSSSFSSFRHELKSTSPHIKGSINIINSGRNNFSQNNNIDCSYMRNEMFPSTPEMVADDADVTPCSRYRHRMKTMRRSFVNIRQPSSIASRDNPVNGTTRFYEPRNSLPCITTQNYNMTGSQACPCDRCRRKAVLLSKMEALGFPSSSAHLSPYSYSYPMSHGYYKSNAQPSFNSSNRYSSCTSLPHTYTTSPGIYCPTNSYDRASPSFQHDPHSNQADIYSLSSLSSISRGVNTDESSYLDTEPSLESPLSYSGIIEDITDLSIKDTVEFFMALKSPLADSQKSNFSDDTSSETFPGLSSEDEAFNCCIGSCACSSVKDSRHSFGSLNIPDMMNVDKLPTSPPHQLKNPNYSDSCPSDAPTQSMSLLYSSLMSKLGLEDELRSAIENIPTE